MFVDTGASVTVLSPKVQARLALATAPGKAIVAGGRVITAERGLLRSLQIAGFPETLVDDLPIRIVDLKVADGALGLNYLARFREVCYDFETGTLRLSR